MHLRIPPLKIKIMFVSNPLKPRILVGGLAVTEWAGRAQLGEWRATSSPQACADSPEHSYYYHYHHYYHYYHYYHY